MSKLEVLELLKEILSDDFDKVLDYNIIMYKIENRISKEKSKPSYFDYTLEEHQEALYG